jgi:hypothetical protein
MSALELGGIMEAPKMIEAPPEVMTPGELHDFTLTHLYRTQKAVLSLCGLVEVLITKIIALENQLNGDA